MQSIGNNFIFMQNIYAETTEQGKIYLAKNCN